MIDPRFYEALGPVTVRALSPSSALHGEEGALVESAAPADLAGPRDLCFVEDDKTLEAARGVVIARKPAPNAVATLISPTPRATFSRLSAQVIRPRLIAADAPAIDASAQLEPGVRLAPGVVIGAGAQIGADTVIGANTVIGPGVAIGRQCRIGANVTIGFALIGDGVAILSGAVIGEQGFGVAGDAQGLIDVPQLGRVILMDRCLIGAVSTVDRGAFDDTIVGEEAKIDNHCQVAHNVVVGRRAVMASFAGLSGSCTVGDGVMMGGRVGLGDHITVGAGAQLAAGSGVLQDVPAGETWAGYPAKPIRAWMRELAWLKRAATRKHDDK